MVSFRVPLLSAFLHFAGDGDFLFQGQSGVDLLGRQQAVPLSHRPSRVGQHVGPVP